MREILTIIACVLIALLTAALAGPWLIDWTSHRALIEAQFEKNLGMKVATRGAIDLKLLPTPRLVLDGVETQGGRGLSFRSQKVRLELAVAPLLRGEFHFIEASFEAPEIEATLGAEGAIVLPKTAATLPDEVRFERIMFTRGHLRVFDSAAGTALDLNDLNLDAEATSLSGPFRGSGSMRAGGEMVGFRFSTGAVEGDRLRLKFVSDQAGVLPRSDLDGALIFTPAGASHRVAFEGAASFSGPAFAGWRFSGPLKLDATGMTIDPLELKLGGDDVALGLSGSGAIDFGGKAQARFTLVARQFDVDRLLALQNANASEIAALPARWIADADFAARAPMPWRLSLATPAMTVGGETLTDIAIDLQVARGAPVAVKLEGSGPGRARLKLDGKFETGAAARFQGRVEAGARDVTRLADWLAKAAPEAATRLRAIPFRAIEGAGEMSVSAAGFSAREMSLKADRSTLKGAAAFTRAVGSERARLFADMNSDALDLDGAPDLTTPGAALADMDFSLGLEARAVRLARFGEGMIDAGRIRLKATRTGETIRLETLSLADIGGASVEANGAIGPTAASFAGRLDAQRLSDLAALLQRVAPGPWSQALAERAVALSPARLTFTGDASRGPDAALRIGSIRLNGTARGTKIEATIKPEVDARNINGVLAIESADASQLIRQFGFETLPLASAGRGVVTAELHGNLDAGYQVKTLAQLAGSRLSFSGALRGSPLAPEMKGEARFVAVDAVPFLRVMTFGLPDFSATLPLEVNAGIESSNGRVSVAAIGGVIAGSKISGDLEAAPQAGVGGRMRVTGALAIQRVSLPTLAGLILGPPQTVRSGALWGEGRFAAGLADTPLADVQISAGQFDLAPNFIGRNAQLTLSMGPGRLQLNDLTTQIGQASLSGRMALRRDGPTASLAGLLDVKDLRVEQKAFAGLIGGRIEFSSTGQSAAALVAGLAGGGTFFVKELIVPRTNAQAPDRVIAQADEVQALKSEGEFIVALRRELDKAPLHVADLAFEATLATGVLRLAETGGISGALDLRNFNLDLRANLIASALPKDWMEPPPRVNVIWKGGFEAPVREVEAGTFVNALSARAIARETMRIDALEGDIRERAFFSRRQRGLAFLRLREREIAAWEVEQTRLAAEEERRKLEDEKRQAEEEKRQALDAARLERERADRERRAAEARRREVETFAKPAPALPAAQTPLRMQVVPGMGTDPSAAGRY